MIPFNLLCRPNFEVRFGFNSEQTALLSVPSGIIAIMVGLSSAWVAGYSNQRLLTLMGFFPFGIVGASLVAILPQKERGAKLLGNYLTNMVPSAYTRRSNRQSGTDSSDTPIIYTLAAANGISS